ncbi:recombination mediator RecR [Patescibacteria group bacterium]|nr:recombination mediator RecR [Patescibacteria group bacterium]
MFPNKLQNLIKEIHKLPTIGIKTAEKITLYLLSQNQDQKDKLIKSINELKDIKLCKACFNFCEKDYCDICLDKKRDPSIICVVAYPKNIQTIEASSKFNGKYHVLHGVLDTINGISEDDIKLKEFFNRIEKNKDKIKEIILGLSPTIEGEATMIYISNKLKKYNIKITRFARGIQVGLDIDYTDIITLQDAISKRTDI